MLSKVKYGSVILGLVLPLMAQAQHCTRLVGNDLMSVNDLSASESGIVICDASFINPPIFGVLCINVGAIGTYTLQNNTPVALKINYTRILNLDGLADAAAVIVPSPTNNCTSSLAAGATCNISIQLNSATAGTFNRILQVGIDTRQVQIDAPAILTAVSDCQPPIPPPTPPAGFVPTVPVTSPDLFRSSILAYATVTNTGPSIVNGDLDLTPGSSVTGFPPGLV